VNAIEAIAAALVVVNVALVAWRSIWNYPVAILAVAIYAVVFAEARLYSDMVLQGFFLVVNLYGWVNWARVKDETGEVIVERLGPAARGAWVAGIAVAALVWGTGMHAFTDASYPWWDAGIAAASVAAQLLQARRVIESWWLWIAVDLASVPLYAVKSLWFTTALYVVLLVISVAGLIDWRRAAVRQMAVAA
jgi:nicotinamide mononucleotide transporter